MYQNYDIAMYICRNYKLMHIQIMTIIDSTQTFHYATIIPFYQLHMYTAEHAHKSFVYVCMLCRALKVIYIIQYPFLQKSCLRLFTVVSCKKWLVKKLRTFRLQGVSQFALPDLLQCRAGETAEMVGCSGFGQTSFSQGKNESPFLQKASNK